MSFDGSLAERTHQIPFKPIVDALRVEVVALVTLQLADVILVLVVLHANGTVISNCRLLVLLFELLDMQESSSKGNVAYYVRLTLIVASACGDSTKETTY